MPTKFTSTGSAPATLIMLLGSALLLSGTVFISGHILLTLARVQAATDRAALDAADAASGRIAGFPCELAQDVAGDHGIALTSCNVERLVSRVTMKTSVYGFQVETRAQAGPEIRVDD